MDFPDEIVVEILRRLPVKSLVRFRCVSKSWRCLISDPTFVRAHLESHMAHISFGTASRIALSRKSDALLSLQAYENGGGDSYGFAVAEELHLDLVKNSNYYVQAHCDGLLCLLIYNEEKSLLVVYNPSIREHRILPVPFPRHYICTPKSVGVGYDPSTDDYKIVRVPSTVEANLCKKRGTIPRVEIYTLKSKSNSWRSLPLEDTPPHGAHIMSQPANAHGGLYWLCRDNASSDRHVILRFDLVEEKFRVVPLPPPVPGEPQYLRWLGSLKDLLSVICFQKATASHFHIWSTKDDKTWTKLITIPTLQGPKPFLYSCQYEPFCYTKSGALLMYIREGEVGFVMYEPGESRFRKLEVRGVENYIHRTLYCESLVSPNCWNEQ